MRRRPQAIATTLVWAALVAVPSAAAAPTAEELARSVQPLRPVVDALRPGASVPLQARSPGVAALQADVLFDFDRAGVRPAGRRAVLRLAAGVARHGGTLRVVGHADGVGDDAYNRRLSLRRAQAVAAVLRPALTAGARIVAEGRGSDGPVADETTSTGKDDPEARARNRRVELRSGR